MKIRSYTQDQCGATAVEFAITAPLYIAAMFGMFQVAMILWAQFGIQNGVEAAARCASVDTTICSSASNIEAYAAQNALGLNLPGSVFSYTSDTCGQKVSANYSAPLIVKLFGWTSIQLTAQACLPT